MQKKIHKGNINLKLYIMRGLPGSGKSTLAKKIGGKIFSTDDFFWKDGKYKCDSAKYPEAHQWNIDRAKKAMEAKEPKVVIDNTNCAAWEMKPYVEAALANKYTIVIAEPDTTHRFDSKKLSETNSHRVPEHIIKEMMDKFESEITVEKILASSYPWED